MEKSVEVTGICPHCGAKNTMESTMVWDIGRNAYMAFCLHCGKKMMLCDNGTCFRCENKTCEIFEDETQLIFAEDCFDTVMRHLKKHFGKIPPDCCQEKLWNWVACVIATDLKHCDEEDRVSVYENIKRVIINTTEEIAFYAKIYVESCVFRVFASEEDCENCDCIRK